ncbi:FtsK/SpoIIIE domain-containing protein [Pseudonocardia eucalypti]|uniref:FtsK/SpoIIIE domain-containing protein n=1 Tax=Pseudonocardia eucalypti TaxID=648755 RepID=A0ABP9RD33_9PSEU|nr:S-DNA-T family DNA segregation ATPase FtsK/SpoIIIE [Pseudonocardia eucalypti]
MNQDHELIESTPVVVEDRRPEAPPDVVPGTTLGSTDLPPRPFDRRPIVPTWIRDARQRKAFVRWLAAYAWHTSAFHTVRLPKYLARIVLQAPLGAGRAIAALFRWVTDAEGRPLRLSAIERGDVTGYMSLSRQRNNRVRLRLTTTASLAACAVSALGVAGVLWPRLSWAVLALMVALAGWHGRRENRPFLDPAVVVQRARKLTPDLVTHAFQAAGLGKEDNPVTFPRPICRDGDGWLALVDLPYGRKAADALKKHQDIAAALDVDEVQVFLDRIRGEGGSARRVALWVADVDVFAQKPAVTALAKADQVDFWKGFRFGQDARKRPVRLAMVWSSLLVGAIPRMGKTFAARLPAAAAALDPWVQLFVFDGKGGKDWQPFELVAHRYGSGARTAVVEHLVHVLHELVEDMNDRYERLRELPNDLCPEGKLTPAIARNKQLGMPLRLVCVDEVQRYLEHPDHGKTVLELLTDLVKVGPAVGIMLVLATQKPDAKVMPDSLRGQLGIRFAMKVMNWQSSDTILGAGAYPDLDASKLLRAHKGVGILLGSDDGALTEFGGQIIRTDLMDLPTLQKICERGRELRITAGTLSGVADGGDYIVEHPAPRLLDDVLAVFTEDEARLWSETVIARLAEANPDAYDGWSPTDLATCLKPYGVTTGQVWGQTPDGRGANRRGISREAVLEALAAGCD